MGLPRYLNNKHKLLKYELENNILSEDLLNLILHFGRNSCINNVGTFILCHFKKIELDTKIIKNKYSDYSKITKEIIKTNYGLYNWCIDIDTDDSDTITIPIRNKIIKVIKTSKYKYSLKYSIKYITIKRKYSKYSDRINDIIGDREWDKLCSVGYDAYMYENKIYKQRCFPSTLKYIIMKRDGYTCQICKRHKNKLPKKIHLEIDHIKAWVDGGETKLNNGQTICSECNKAKHHSKRYLKEAV